MLIRVLRLISSFLRFVPFARVIRSHVVVLERLLRLVDVFDVVYSVLSLDNVWWLHTGSWLTMDQALRGELSLLYTIEVLPLFLILFLCFLELDL